MDHFFPLAIKRASPIQLYDEVQAALYKRHKVSRDVLLSLRTLFNTLWLGLCLH